MLDSSFRVCCSTGEMLDCFSQGLPVHGAFRLCPTGEMLDSACHGILPHWRDADFATLLHRGPCPTIYFLLRIVPCTRPLKFSKLNWGTVTMSLPVAGDIFVLRTRCWIPYSKFYRAFPLCLRTRCWTPHSGFAAQRARCWIVFPYARCLSTLPNGRDVGFPMPRYTAPLARC